MMAFASGQFPLYAAFSAARIAVGTARPVHFDFCAALVHCAYAWLAARMSREAACMHAAHASPAGAAGAGCCGAGCCGVGWATGGCVTGVVGCCTGGVGAAGVG